MIYYLNNTDENTEMMEIKILRRLGPKNCRTFNKKTGICIDENNEVTE